MGMPLVIDHCSNDFKSPSFLDADECSIPNICGAGKCKNLLGSYECICNEGFRRDTFGQCDGL